MTRWGLFAVTIGCIIMMYSQTYNDLFTKKYCIVFVVSLLLCLGALYGIQGQKNVKKK